jgi:hypothetical protein
MTESNDEFLRRILRERNYIDSDRSIFFHIDIDRILALARRGAAIPDEATEAMFAAYLAEFTIAEGYRAMIQTALKEAKT